MCRYLTTLMDVFLLHCCVAGTPLLSLTAWSGPIIKETVRMHIFKTETEPLLYPIMTIPAQHDTRPQWACKKGKRIDRVTVTTTSHMSLWLGQCRIARASRLFRAPGFIGREWWMFRSIDVRISLAVPLLGPDLQPWTQEIWKMSQKFSPRWRALLQTISDLFETSSSPF